MRCCMSSFRLYCISKVIPSSFEVSFQAIEHNYSSLLQAIYPLADFNENKKL